MLAGEDFGLCSALLHALAPRGLQHLVGEGQRAVGSGGVSPIIGEGRPVHREAVGAFRHLGRPPQPVGFLGFLVHSHGHEGVRLPHRQHSGGDVVVVALGASCGAVPLHVVLPHEGSALGVVDVEVDVRHVLQVVRSSGHGPCGQQPVGGQLHAHGSRLSFAGRLSCRCQGVVLGAACGEEQASHEADVSFQGHIYIGVETLLSLWVEASSWPRKHLPALSSCGRHAGGFEKRGRFPAAAQARPLTSTTFVLTCIFLLSRYSPALTGEALFLFCPIKGITPRSCGATVPSWK